MFLRRGSRLPHESLPGGRKWGRRQWSGLKDVIGYNRPKPR